MTLYTILIVVLLVAAACYVIWKFMPDPIKTVLLWIIGIGFTIWLLNILGLFDSLRGINV